MSGETLQHTKSLSDPGHDEVGLMGERGRSSGLWRLDMGAIDRQSANQANGGVGESTPRYRGIAVSFADSTYHRTHWWGATDGDRELPGHGHCHCHLVQGVHQRYMRLDLHRVEQSHV